MRSFVKRSNGMPEATSTTRASTSKPYCALYAHRVPGWKSSGTFFRRGITTESASPAPIGTCETWAALAPPLINPDVCVSRSRTVIGRVASTVRVGSGAAIAFVGCATPSVLRTVTFRFCSSGMNRETGSVSRSLPFLDQHHHRDADDGLRHRHDAEDGVLRHRLLRLEVHQPLRLEVRDAAVPRDERDGAAEGLRVDMALHQLGDTLQPLR